MKTLYWFILCCDICLLLNSAEEAGRYLETYKAYENKPADSLKEKVEQDFLSRVSSTGLSILACWPITVKEKEIEKNWI